MFRPRFLLVLSGSVFLLAILAGLFLAQPEAASVSPQPPQQASTAHNTKLDGPSSTAHSNMTEEHERPFWKEAEVPDSGVDEPAAVAIIPRRPSSEPLRDYAAEVKAFEKSGEIRQLNDSLMLWFNQDPTTATTWINETEHFEDIAPSLHLLAQGIANSGHLETALAWADEISDTAKRHETLLRIYAHEARQRKVTRESLQQQGFSQDDIAVIFSGALGD